jgi:CrcB protein
METALKTAMINAGLVGLGGFLGVLGRYGLSEIVHRQLPFGTFPYGTLVVNLVGCFGVGVVAGLAEARQVFGPEFRLFALIGILGGLTTFSTFGYETFLMLRNADYLGATVNVAAHVVVGLALVWMGYAITT